MKRCFLLFVSLALCLSLFGCAESKTEYAQVAATTLPVYEFASRICEGTPIRVTRLVTENVSCLHDYSVSVRQVQAIEKAEVVILSGAGLELFLGDLLEKAPCVVDASAGVPLLALHDHDEENHDHDHGEFDPHIWLSPKLAGIMAENIRDGLSRRYPEYADRFAENADALISQLDQLQQYGQKTLSDLSCRELITFHDGFSYFAQAFDLTILEAVEEEAGSEASASTLKRLITLTKDHSLPAVFTEISGSTSASGIVAAETGAAIYALDMAMSGDSYFDAMYHNIDIIKEALK